MKVLNKVVLGMASLVLLTGCMSKTNYSDFHKKAVEAEEKAPAYTKATAKGNVKQSIVGVETSIDVDVKFEKNEDGDWEVKEGSAAGAAIAALYLSYRASMVGDSGDITYYAGNGFKATAKDEDSATSYVFNQYGYVTSAKGNSDSGKLDLTFTWSK